MFAQIDPARIRGAPGRSRRARVERSIQDAVKNGLRAQLKVQSLLTGQLYVGLDYSPDTPARLTGIDKDYCEIPTIPTALAQIQDQMKKIMAELEQLPLKQIVEAVARTLEGVDRLVHAPELVRAVKSLDTTLVEAQALMRNVNARIDPTAARLAGDARAGPAHHRRGRPRRPQARRERRRPGQAAGRESRIDLRLGPGPHAGRAEDAAQRRRAARPRPDLAARRRRRRPRCPAQGRDVAEPGGRRARRELAARLPAGRRARAS